MKATMHGLDQRRATSSSGGCRAPAAPAAARRARPGRLASGAQASVSRSDDRRGGHQEPDRPGGDDRALARAAPPRSRRRRGRPAPRPSVSATSRAMPSRVSRRCVTPSRPAVRSEMPARRRETTRSAVSSTGSPTTSTATSTSSQPRSPSMGERRGRGGEHESDRHAAAVAEEDPRRSTPGCTGGSPRQAPARPTTTMARATSPSSEAMRAERQRGDRGHAWRPRRP